MEQTDLRYLKSLAKQYPTVAAAATEIINLQAILSLPKGTEHFITDIHGEYDQFQHVLKNGSGAIKRKIEDEFGNAISQAEKKSIATLIYYPELLSFGSSKSRSTIRFMPQRSHTIFSKNSTISWERVCAMIVFSSTRCR